MKEQLFEILHNRKRMPGERFSDIESKIENFVNQEVERRIAERMPSEEEIKKEIFQEDPVKDGDNEWLYGYRQGRFSGSLWLRSRLTKPGAETSQKTEGGGE